MDLFPQVPMGEARQIVQTSGCDLEAATAQTLAFIEAQTVSQQQVGLLSFEHGCCCGADCVTNCRVVLTDWTIPFKVQTSGC